MLSLLYTALARRDWKIGTFDAEVPYCIATGSIQNDILRPSDELAIVLCPLYSESDSVKRVMDMCDEESIPCLLINPELINMDQGLGVRKFIDINIYVMDIWIIIPILVGARNMKKNILNTFTSLYKLKTLRQGALVKEHPFSYSLWMEDRTKEMGYSLLKSFSTEPSSDTIMELFEVSIFHLILLHIVMYSLSIFYHHILTLLVESLHFECFLCFAWKSNDNPGDESNKAIRSSIKEVVGFFKGLSQL